MSAVPSSANAISSAASSSAQSCTFVTPTDEPARAGLTNTGRPSPRARRSQSSRSRAHDARVTDTHGATATPAPCSTVFVKCLSMPSADASTPLPTYGRPSSSSSPCTVPSSPNRPCRIGNTTSTSPSERDPPIRRDDRELARRRRLRASAPAIRCRRPPAARGRARTASASSGCSVHAPSWVMPIGTTSYLVRSIAPSTPPAVAQLIECSLERPPKRSATRIMSIHRPIRLAARRRS